MSLYFSFAVWASLALAAFPLIAHLLPHYLVSSSRGPDAAGTYRWAILNRADTVGAVRAGTTVRGPNGALR